VPGPTAVTAVVTPCPRLGGRLSVPGDKSISHRYALLAALAHGTTVIDRFAPGADCAATLGCLRTLGVALHRDGPDRVVIAGRGLGGLMPPVAVLDAANSGSTMRMLAGVVAAHPFSTTITGDASLRRRPMGRVATPLTLMGARVDTVNGTAPLTVHGARLRGIEFFPQVPSAQVKSAVLLAGIQAEGLTRVVEPAVTRDHTERALRAFGVPVTARGGEVAVTGGTPLTACALTVPGDISSAAFWAVAAATLPGSEIEIEGVGLNPTRTGILDVLERAGALVERETRQDVGGEPSGSLRVRPGPARPLVIAPSEVPSVIDELPVLGVLGALGAGIEVRGAAELRTKESDRIARLVEGFRALGLDAEEHPDGFTMPGAQRPAGGEVDAHGDHRLAMAFAIAGLAAVRPTHILGAEAVDVSYPGFFAVLPSLRA
jgi:3-phosphoshikimate 1-carboxyvinyltransferase